MAYLVMRQTLSLQSLEEVLHLLEARAHRPGGCFGGGNMGLAALLGITKTLVLSRRREADALSAR